MDAKQNTPRTDDRQRSLTVVGGGVIGLTCALAAADSGRAVTLYDDPTGDRAAWVAAGMLGSLGEGLPGEDMLLELSTEAVRRWPDLIARLGVPSILAAQDSLFVATTSADAAHYAGLAEFVWSRQRRARAALRSISADEVRALESGLGPRVHSGYLASGEGAVDNRLLLSALRTAVPAAGVAVVDRRIADLAELDADDILVAAGLGSGELISGLGLYPAKGEILRLRATAWSVPAPQRVVRGRVDGRSVYLVPRGDGIVVGATQYEPFDDAVGGPEVGGVADLLADALELMPGLRTYELAEVGVGARPCAADGLPIIRRVDERIVVATGHGRNGILLAPYTADAVTALLDDPSLAVPPAPLKGVAPC